ncbi:Imm17 family immunity protein, partial [Bacteroides ovatus]
LWFFDDCKPETRRRIKIVLVSVLIILILVDFFVWR